MWYDLLRAGRKSDAKDMQKQLSVILSLPYVSEISMLYDLISTIPLLEEGDISQAEEKLDNIAQFVGDASDDVVHLFHRRKARVYYVRHEYRKSLGHYMHALDVKGDTIKDNASVYHGIGYCYYHMARPFDAIRYLELAKMHDSKEYLINVRTVSSIQLATCYRVVGKYKEARALHESTLAHAQSISHDTFVGATLNNLSRLCVSTGDFKEALDYSEKSMKYLECNNIYFMHALSNKANALLGLKEYAQCKEVAEQGRAMAIAEDSETWIISFETIWHSMNLSDNASTDYLENVAIPHFINRSGMDRYEALDICNTLEAHYKRRKLNKKVLAITATSRDLYKEMIMGNE